MARSERPRAERRLQILQQLVGGPEGLSSSRLCRVASDVVDVSGAGVMLMSGEVSAGRACSSDAVATALEDLQFTLGEGPCVDAYRDSRPVLEPDLVEPVSARWPAFTPAAIDVGARALFGFPLQIGAARLGAINLYRDEAGPLTEQQHADALVTADIVARALLAMQADASPGKVASEIEAGGDLQLVVHQASGMVAAQLEVSVAEALIRLRAFAFVSDQLLPELARAVVGRQIRFDTATGEPGVGS
jgi:hypothetical protein